MALVINDQSMWGKGATTLKNALLKALSEHYKVAESDVTDEQFKNHWSIAEIHKLSRDSENVSDSARQALIDYLTRVPGMTEEQLASGEFTDTAIDQHHFLMTMPIEFVE